MTIHHHLISHIHPIRQKALNRLIKDIHSDFTLFLQRHSVTIQQNEESDILFFDFLKESIYHSLKSLQDLGTVFDTFNTDYSKSVSGKERHAYILQYAFKLHKNEKLLKEDTKALSRWMGYDTMVERFMKIKAEKEQLLTFLIERLCIVYPDTVKEYRQTSGETLSRKFQISMLFEKILALKGDIRIHISLLNGILYILQNTNDCQDYVFSEPLNQSVKKLSMDSSENIWIQCHALRIIKELHPDIWIELVKQRFTHPLQGDDIFIRQDIVKSFIYSEEDSNSSYTITSFFLRDPSEFVRQSLWSTLSSFPETYCRKTVHDLLKNDPSPKVRGSLIHSIFSDKPISLQRKIYNLSYLADPISEEKDPLVLKITLLGIRNMCMQCLSEDTLCNNDMFTVLHTLLTSISSKQNRRELPLSLKSQYSEIVELLCVVSDSTYRNLLKKLSPIIRKIHLGKSGKLKKKQLDDVSIEDIGRVLAVLCQNDFELHIKQGFSNYIFFRGPRFRFRMWRFLYELVTPSPDKREGFNHTTGRTLSGNIRISSGMLSELTETKVPGEPLYIEEEESYRPYLPLTDDYIQAVHPMASSNTISIYSSHGITTIQKPNSIFKQIKAYLSLTFRFREYASLRNWDSTKNFSADSFLKKLSALGFTTLIIPYESQHKSTDASDSMSHINRFFPALGFPLIPEITIKFRDYFMSLYENSFFELIIFTSISLIIFLGRHLISNQKVKKSRKAIPLSIGGWGTRGKSGTERLKAALLNSEGYGVVSKTTGCEAMFLKSSSFCPLNELLLFRPYEKATIWEQADLLHIAEKAECDVFLWECMALQPAFVHIMQKQWMRDDISTLTNAFPDHEDVMGPAGYNISEVMAEFIPEHSTLITTEHQMTPVLKHYSEKASTRFIHVEDIEAQLLSDELLSRFPYSEHPSNISLVLKLADEIGIDRDKAIMEMADRVIPDIGMLITYPCSDVDSRKLEFTNGMSANERLGCLSNWKRLEFNKIQPYNSAGTLVSVVVNNRADRIPRSKVFADIMVNDIQVDYYFLIGTNLNGLQGYIRESWENNTDRFKLDGLSIEKQLSRFEEISKYFRIPLNQNQIINRIQIMCNPFTHIETDPINIGELVHSDSVENSLTQLFGEKTLTEKTLTQLIYFISNEKEKLSDYLTYRKVIETQKHKDEALEKLLWKWFQNKFVVINDSHASGDKINHTIKEQTPPGHLNRILGIQNIKGTGMDFVFSWQNRESCHTAINLLESGKEQLFNEGLDILVSLNKYGLLSLEQLEQSLIKTRNSWMAQNEKVQTKLMIIDETLKRSKKAIHEAITKSEHKQHYLKTLIDGIEGFLDIGDAIRRKKTAQKIYSDLINQRISHKRATEELNYLQSKQKGGWLYKQIIQFQNRVFNSKQVR